MESTLSQPWLRGCGLRADWAWLGERERQLDGLARNLMSCTVRSPSWAVYKRYGPKEREREGRTIVQSTCTGCLIGRMDAYTGERHRLLDGL